MTARIASSHLHKYLQQMQSRLINRQFLWNCLTFPQTPELWGSRHVKKMIHIEIFNVYRI